MAASIDPFTWFSLSANITGIFGISRIKHFTRICAKKIDLRDLAQRYAQLYGMPRSAEFFLACGQIPMTILFIRDIKSRAIVHFYRDHLV